MKHRRDLREQRKDINEAHAKSMFITDGAEFFTIVDHEGDKIRARMRRRIIQIDDKILLDLLDEYERHDDLEDRVVMFMNDKATTQRPFLTRAAQAGERVLAYLRGK